MSTFVERATPRLAMMGHDAGQGAPRKDKADYGDEKNEQNFTLEELMSQLRVALAETAKMIAGLVPQQPRYNADTGDIVIPIYLDGSVLDEVIITAQQRKALRSGGR